MMADPRPVFYVLQICVVFTLLRFLQLLPQFLQE